MQLGWVELWWSQIMARFATFIADPDLESLAIKAISAVNGELLIRGVSVDQLLEIPSDVSIITNRDYIPRINNSRIRINPQMDLEFLIDLLNPKSTQKKVTFQKGNSKVHGFLGLSGGAGTTSIAINYAFELAKQTAVALIDLNEQHPEIALNLNLRRLDGQVARAGSNLAICKGLPNSSESLSHCDLIIFDLGTNLNHELLPFVDSLYVVSRINKNLIFRLTEMSCIPQALICNFSERSKYQDLWLEEIKEKFSTIKTFLIPRDTKAFDLAAETRSALLEVAPNSLARKYIATLI
jgi:Flp pilus assembly CpaE family ATPase